VKRNTLGVLNFTGTGAFAFSQISQRSADTKPTKLSVKAAGRPAASQIGVVMLEPMITATTSEIKRFLSNVDLLVGMPIQTGGGGITGLDAYFTKMKPFSTRGGSGEHFKLGGITLGMVVPKQLTVTFGQSAAISFEIYAISSDGITDAWSYTDSVSLPGTPVADQFFGLAPSWVNGSAVPGLQGLTWDFGLKAKLTHDSGNRFPIQVGIDEQDPVLTLKTNDITNLVTFGVDGAPQGATASKIFIRQYKNQDVPYADNTNNHILFTIPANQGYWEASQASGGNNEETEVNLTCTPIDGSSPLASITFDQPIAA